MGHPREEGAAHEHPGEEPQPHPELQPDAGQARVLPGAEAAGTRRQASSDVKGRQDCVDAGTGSRARGVG